MRAKGIWSPLGGTLGMNLKRTARWRYRLKAEFGARDVTGDVADLISESGVADGIVVVSVTGSTGAITTIEFEPGALKDLRDALDRIAPTRSEERRVGKECRDRWAWGHINMNVM